MDERRDRRQIDRIEQKIDKLCLWVNGEGEVLGAKDKLNIMWQYRIWFIGIVAANAITAVVYFVESWNK